MAQYKTGTVSVTNGSATVTGSGTAFSANLTAGNLFTVEGDNVAYTVASAPTATILTLTAPYSGVTGSGKIYGVTIDFTPDLGLPLMSIGDLNTAAIYNESMKNIDNLNLDDLGTAAFADLTASVTSENTASVSKVGTGGLVVPMSNMDWNTFDAGLNVFLKGSVNSPTGTNVFGFQSSDGASYATRFVGRNGAFYTQSVEAGVVGSWNEVWTTKNTTVDINGFIKEL